MWFPYSDEIYTMYTTLVWTLLINMAKLGFLWSVVKYHIFNIQYMVVYQGLNSRFHICNSIFCYNTWSPFIIFWNISFLFGVHCTLYQMWTNIEFTITSQTMYGWFCKLNSYNESKYKTPCLQTVIALENIRL